MGTGGNPGSVDVRLSRVRLELSVLPGTAECIQLAGVDWACVVSWAHSGWLSTAGRFPFLVTSGFHAL